MELRDDGYLSREAHISILQQQKKTAFQAKTEKIKENYEKCVKGDEYLMESIIDDLDKIYKSMVSRKLYTAGCYDDETELTAMQEARLSVWAYIDSSIKEGRVDSDFVEKCKGIYHHKAIDVVRSVLKERKRCSGEVESLDRMLPDENTTVGSLISDSKHDGNRPESVIEDEERRNFYDTAFKLYCQALMDSDAEPSRGLALHYSRILPHILQVFFSVETIPDSKAASPKWAIEKMGDRTIGALSEEAEKQLNKYISDTLVWCTEHMRQLDDEIDTSAGVQIMRDVVYVTQYDEKQIGHMTDYMHKTVARDWLKLIKNNPKAVESALEFTAGKDKLAGMLRGGLER